MPVPDRVPAPNPAQSEDGWGSGGRDKPRGEPPTRSRRRGRLADPAGDPPGGPSRSRRVAVPARIRTAKRTDPRGRAEALAPAGPQGGQLGVRHRLVTRRRKPSGIDPWSRSKSNSGRARPDPHTERTTPDRACEKAGCSARAVRRSCRPTRDLAVAWRTARGIDPAVQVEFEKCPCPGKPGHRMLRRESTTPGARSEPPAGACGRVSTSGPCGGARGRSNRRLKVPETRCAAPGGGRVPRS